MNIAERLLMRFTGMETGRSPYEPLWRTLSDHYLPHKSFSSKAKGGEGSELIWDSTPAHAHQQLSARLFGMIMPPSEQWLGIGFRALAGTGDEDGFKEWTSKTSEKVLAFLANEETGFYTAAADCLENHVLQSMYVKYIEEDDESIIRCQAIPLSECYVAESARGVVDTVYRKYQMTVRQMVQTWKETGVSKRVKDLLDENKPEEQIDILHCVYPREDRDPGDKSNRGMPYASVHLEVQEKHVLAESGYHEMPFSCPRWNKGPGEVYGCGSPAMVALPSARLLYAEIRTAQLAAEKAASPSLLVPDDGVLGNVNTGPDGITYFRTGTGDQISTLYKPGMFDMVSMKAMIDRTDENIRQIFYSNRLDDNDRPNMTATEATIKRNDRWQSLAAMLGRIQNEGMTQEMYRIVMILMRRGELDALPDGYTPRNIRFFYTNQLTQSQRQQGIQSSRIMMEMVAPLVGTTDPYGVMDNFDTDAMARRAHESSGAPADELRKKSDVTAIREKKAKQAQAQAAMAQADQLANTAATASKADMGGNNLMTTVLGGGQ